jgi:hypothetical protein
MLYFRLKKGKIKNLIISWLMELGLKMNTIQIKKVTEYFVLILITGVILTFIAFSVHEAVGQETSSNRQLNVIFDSIKINNDHDPLFPGEWKIDSYVNGQRTQLWIGSELNRVSTGETITFRDKNINVTIPENGTLRIVTVGAEFDIDLDDTLPNISGILDKDLPFLDYLDKAKDSIESIINFDRNDAIGIIAKEYSAENNFGIGRYDECSESIDEEGDLYDAVDTSCDFRLRYTIKEKAD